MNKPKQILVNEQDVIQSFASGVGFCAGLIVLGIAINPIGDLFPLGIGVTLVVFNLAIVGYKIYKIRKEMSG